MNEFSARRAESLGSDVESEGQKTGRRRPLVIDLPYGRIRAVLWTVTLTVVALGIFREAWVHLFNSNNVLWKLRLINFDSENSVPEWWSTIQFVMAAALLVINGVADPERRWKPYWFALAAIFIFLSIDESAGAHELFMGLLARYHFTDFLRYSWIVPYSGACLVVGSLYVPFVLALPSQFRWRVILAGGVFVTSAMGFESIGGRCVNVRNQLCRILEIIAEESGETIGLTIFIIALAAILRTCSRAVTLSL
jgi:hypothetical protein